MVVVFWQVAVKERSKWAGPVGAVFWEVIGFRDVVVEQGVWGPVMQLTWFALVEPEGAGAACSEQLQCARLEDGFEHKGGGSRR